MLFGLGAGVLYAFGGLGVDILTSMGWVGSAETPGLSYGTLLVFGALIGMLLIGAIIWFVVGLVGALLYNMFAGWFGGIAGDIVKKS